MTRHVYNYYYNKKGDYTPDGMHKIRVNGYLTRNGCKHYHDCFNCPLPDCYFGLAYNEKEKVAKRKE